MQPEVWPADAVERRPIGELIPYARNARTHSAEQVSQIAASIREFGFTVPVLVDEAGGIIAGHGRVMAAKELGLKAVPVMTARGWSEVQKRAYILADNQLPLNAGWDPGLLKGEIEALQAFGFDLGVTGFDAPSIAGILAYGVGGDRDPDAVPEVPTESVSKIGDIWLLGGHRLICGDSTDAAAVERCLSGARVDLILTDPPYCSGGFQETAKSAGSVGTSATHKQIANDTLSTRGYMALLKTAFANLGAPYLYAFTDWRMWVHLFDVAESSGFGVRSMICWDKGTPGMGRGWRAQHELILWGCKQTPPFSNKDAGAGNVISAKRTGNVHHTTEKPVDLLQALLRPVPFAKVVADPFTGSGSMMIAAEIEGRTFFGLELDPVYVDVAVKRWQEFTGKEATLEATGESFSATSSKRLAKPKGAKSRGGVSSATPESPKKRRRAGSSETPSAAPMEHGLS